MVGYHTEKFNIYYRLDGLDEIITNPGNFAGTPPQALDREYITDGLMQQLQVLIFNAKLGKCTGIVYSFHPGRFIRLL
jgi:hypothetical protein